MVEKTMLANRLQAQPAFLFNLTGIFIVFELLLIIYKKRDFFAIDDEKSKELVFYKMNQKKELLTLMIMPSLWRILLWVF